MLVSNFQTKTIHTPFINTGTIYDLVTGSYDVGKNNKWYLNGGLSLTMAIAGRGQTFKSGVAGSLVANSLFNHPTGSRPGIEASVYESEFTIQDATRYDDFVPSPVSDRIIFNNKSTMDITDWFAHLKELGEYKLANKKDYIVDSPFIDIRTGKPQKMWIPTISLCDSWSLASSSKENELFSGKEKVDDSSMNTLFMHDGLVKTRIMRALPQLAAKYGIYFIFTAHVGNKIEMDAYSKSPKQLQYMKQADRLKQVGGNFEFLTSALMQTAGVQALTASGSTKECMYPYGKRSNLTEVNEVNVTTVRCKNNMSGTIMPYVVSQHQGILNDVTYFHLLKKNGDFGMTAKGGNYTTLIGDKSMTRRNIRTINEYETSRALQLLAEICYIQRHWSPYGKPEWVYTPIEKIKEILDKNTSLSSDILNSVGHWSWNKQERKYMSTMDALELISKEK